MLKGDGKIIVFHSIAPDSHCPTTAIVAATKDWQTRAAPVILLMAVTSITVFAASTNLTV